MLVVTIVFDDSSLLPHFLRHYQHHGAQRFVIGVYAAQGLEGAVREAARHYPATVLPIAGPNHPEAERRFALDAARRLVGPREWWAVADLDEFHAYPNPLAEVRELLDAHGAAFLTSRLLDRLTADGSCPPLQPEAGLWEQFPAAAWLTGQMNGLDDRKVMLVRGHARFCAGHHDLEAPRRRLYQVSGGAVHHFKWHGNIVERMRSKRDRLKARGSRFYRNIERFLRYWDAHGRMPTDGQFGFHFPPKPASWPD